MQPHMFISHHLTASCNPSETVSQKKTFPLATGFCQVVYLGNKRSNSFKDSVRIIVEKKLLPINFHGLS